MSVLSYLMVTAHTCTPIGHTAEGYVTEYKSGCQEDVSHNGGDEALEVGSSHLEQHTASLRDNTLLLPGYWLGGYELYTYIFFKSESHHREMPDVIRAERYRRGRKVYGVKIPRYSV